MQSSVSDPENFPASSPFENMIAFSQFLLSRRGGTSTFTPSTLNTSMMEQVSSKQVELASESDSGSDGGVPVDSSSAMPHGASLCTGEEEGESESDAESDINDLLADMLREERNYEDEGK